MEPSCGFPVLLEDESLDVGVFDVFRRLVLGDLCGVAARVGAAIARRVVGDHCWGLIGGFFLEEGSALRRHELRVYLLGLAAA